jgi:hypothetical protein
MVIMISPEAATISGYVAVRIRRHDTDDGQGVPAPGTHDPPLSSKKLMMERHQWSRRFRELKFR